jgi:hypothetical protein
VGGRAARSVVFEASYRESETLAEVFFARRVNGKFAYLIFVVINTPTVRADAGFVETAASVTDAAGQGRKTVCVRA